MISMFAVNPAQHARVLCASRAAATPSLGLRPCSERTTAAGLHVQITCLCTPVRTSLCSRGATRSVSSDRCGHVRGGGSRRQLACRAAVQPAAPGQTTIGFLGIGIMGLAMARNLMKAGYKVVVWNRNPDKCAPLKAEGAEVRCAVSRAMQQLHQQKQPPQQQGRPQWATTHAHCSPWGMLQTCGWRSTPPPAAVPHGRRLALCSSACFASRSTVTHPPLISVTNCSSALMT